MLLIRRCHTLASIASTRIQASKYAEYKRHLYKVNLGIKFGKCIISATKPHIQNSLLPNSHCYSTNNDSTLSTEGEIRLTEKLKTSFPDASIQVNDISGGCGDMYEVHISSSAFINKRTIQQHKLVTASLKEEVKKMHGLRIFTSLPE
uniref:BolA-like protein 3 n=1 Tax=Phallusia mammillata TaxID=59560 RepID=A0A6F9D8I2_9ASCI|nr:bolA-like protein 3 [Phallusia mammillata]